jgi:hypothetical protein
VTDEALAVALRDRLAGELAGLPNVHGVGLGGRWRANDPTGEPCLTVFVHRKVPAGILPRDALVPRGLGGLSTDVVELRPPRRLQATGDVLPGSRRLPTRLGWRFVADNARYPYLCGGIQVMSHIRGLGLGTLGCLLQAVDDEDAVYALTCYHVLEGGTEQRPVAPTATTRVGHPTAGVSVLGCCSHQFGNYAGGLDPAAGQGVERLDAAVVRLDPGTMWAPLITQIGAVGGMHAVTWSDVIGGTYQIRKRGITTRLTGGVIMAVGYLSQDAATMMTSPPTNANDMVIRPNPDPTDPTRQMYTALEGDSGSAVVNDANEVVGLVWGAAIDESNQALADGIAPELGAAFATPISHVLARLKDRTGLDLVVAVWDPSHPEIRTVPGATAPPAPSMSAPAVSGHLLERDFPRLGGDLAGFDRGARLIDLWLRHQHELARLIKTNRKVAARWHRGGGASLFQAAARCIADPRLRIPESIDGRPTGSVIVDFVSVLARHASEDLGRAARDIGDGLAPIAGLSYPEALAMLRRAS